MPGDEFVGRRLYDTSSFDEDSVEYSTQYPALGWQVEVVFPRNDKVASDKIARSLVAV